MPRYIQHACVQVMTRFLFSSCPYLFIFAASLLQEGGGDTLDATPLQLLTQVYHLFADTATQLAATFLNTKHNFDFILSPRLPRGIVSSLGFECGGDRRIGGLDRWWCTALPSSFWVLCSTPCTCLGHE
jgi:hypothetical protein